MSISAGAFVSQNEPERITPAVIWRNAVVGLAVSFVALSLGAAFGLLSGRGAFAGMLSAGVISIIASLLGGTRVQCSGPTAPMSVATATVVALAYDELQSRLPGSVPDHFINIVILLSCALVVLMGLLRLGRFIALVPNVVVSGFMNGIAMLVWASQINRLFGLAGEQAFAGPLAANLLIALATLALIFALPVLANRFLQSYRRFVPPPTLVALVVLTAGAHLFALPVATIDLQSGLGGWDGLVDLVVGQWPRDWSAALLWLALPFALQLALLSYLDTLLTSLVVDKMVGEQTQQNKELLAQGVANGAVALLGGIPGAMATIRSVLVLKEGGTQRMVGVFIGVFVLVEMLLFQDLISIIPQAVFAGILFKVGYDVFDFEPVLTYVRRWGATERKSADALFVSHLEIMLIAGTTIATLLWNLNAAVGLCTALFYLINKVLCRDNPIRDLKPYEGHGVGCED